MYKSNKYEIGDIVFVSKYDYDDTEKGENHLFVIIDENDNQLVPIEYFGLIVSSHREKGKDLSKFKYNEPLVKKEANGLNKDSIVKCDYIFIIPKKNILFKIGQVDIDDYIRFMNTYQEFIADKTKELQEV